MKIIVDTENQKQEILTASKLLHDFTVVVYDLAEKSEIVIITDYLSEKLSDKERDDLNEDVEFVKASEGMVDEDMSMLTPNKYHGIKIEDREVEQLSLPISDNPGLNFLAHLYTTPELIEVKNDKE